MPGASLNQAVAGAAFVANAAFCRTALDRVGQNWGKSSVRSARIMRGTTARQYFRVSMEKNRTVRRLRIAPVTLPAAPIQRLAEASEFQETGLPGHLHEALHQKTGANLPRRRG